VTTIEGLARGDRLHPLQEAFIEQDVPQCGYCQSGQVMSAAALWPSSDNPTDADIDAAMSGISAAAALISVFARPSSRRRPHGKGGPEHGTPSLSP
jgi:aerobic-type carbon monoxide dehydrogenase small subunit (CoxS/CutS family)